mgnify:CR=1 FL=1
MSSFPRPLLRWLLPAVVALPAAVLPGAAQPAAAVTLSGTVRDAATGEDLPGATVRVVERATGTVSNAYGFYSLTVPPGTYTVEVSYVGYAPLPPARLTLTSSLTRNFQLSAAGQQLAEAQVTATRADRVQTAEMSVERMEIATANKIPVVLGEKDILKSLQFLPGVATAGEGAAGFNVRGGAADQNLVLLDEATLYNPSHLFGFFSVFNSEAVKEFTLYKGGIPAAYGGRLSSVLDVRQREGNRRRVALSGGVGLIASRLTVEGPLDKDSTGEGRGSWMLAGRRSYADVFLPLSPERALKDTKLYFYDLNAKANYQLNANNRLFLSGYFGRDRLELPRTFGTQWGSSTATLRWNHLFSDRLFTNFSAVYSNYDYRLRVFANNPFTWDSNILNYSLKGDASWFLAGQTIEFGAISTAYDFRPGRITPFGSESTVETTSLDPKYALESGVYVSDETRLGKLSVKVGLRFSHFLRLGRETIREYAGNQPVVYDPGAGAYANGRPTGERRYTGGARIAAFRGWEPRAALSYALTDAQAVKLSYQRTYQYLHQISNTTSPTPIDIYTPSGPYLRPAHADQVALGYAVNLAGRAWDASVETYYKDLRDVADYVDGASLTFNNHLETELLRGRGRAYGLEVLLRRNTGRLTGWVSYTLARSERQTPGVGGGPGINGGAWYAANIDQRHNLAATVAYDLNDRWSASAAFVYTSGRPFTNPVGRFAYNGLLVPAYGARNGGRLPDFHHLDVSLTYLRPPRGRWQGKWIFGVYNLYNRLNAASIYFREKSVEINGADIGTGETQAIKLSYFGIVPSVSYEFSFGR